MRVTLWGTRGSLPSPGPDTARYGGNTPCVEVRGADGSLLVLDAGTGIRRLGVGMSESPPRLDILLTHLHMDHIQALAFFWPLRSSSVKAHLWGPASTALSLRERLGRYLSPPLFPVFLRDMSSIVELHEIADSEFEIGNFHVRSVPVCHPDTTVGYRIEGEGAAVTYLPDHEPALGARVFPLSSDWTSGHELAAGADLLIHDAQFDDAEYADRVGFGHSSMADACRFGALAEVKRLVLFHHDPGRTDEALDRLTGATLERMKPAFRVEAGVEGTAYELPVREADAAAR